MAEHASTLSPPQSVLSVDPSGGDYSKFFQNMENKVARTLTHQRSMIEVPAEIYDLQHEFPANPNGDDDDDDDEEKYDGEDSTVDEEQSRATNVTSIGPDDDFDEEYETDDEDLDEKDPELQKALGKEHDISVSSDDEDDNNTTVDDNISEISHSRDRSVAKTELTDNLSSSIPPSLGRQVSPYQDKRASQIDNPSSPGTKSPMRNYKKRSTPEPHFPIDTSEPTSNNTTEKPMPNGSSNNNNNSNNIANGTTEMNGTHKTKTVITVGDATDTTTKSTNTDTDVTTLKKELTPSAESTGSMDDNAFDEKLKNGSGNRRRSTKKQYTSKRRSTRSKPAPAQIANTFDEEEANQNSDDEFNTFKMNDNEDSKTMDLDIDAWLLPQENKFEECDLRFDEDRQGGKKPPAAEFRNLGLFFRFFYDRFYHNGTLLMESSLPSYQEWKQSRKVKFRNNQIKKIDHALKACNESVHSLKSMCYNCSFLCYDEGQNPEVNYSGCQAPKIQPCIFEVGPYSIIGCWDLFELGASPSDDDWRRSLANDCVAQFLCHCQPDLRHFDKEQRAEQYAFQIIKKYQLYCLSEHMKNYGKQLVFGSSMEWKKIKTAFMKKCDKDILGSIDHFTYFLNPKVDNLAAILSDTAGSTAITSKKKILCEPILWLIYVGYYLLDRQQKLQQLIFSSYHYQDNNTKVKGQKLKTMIDNLAKQAKEESERLRTLMAKLPSQEDLQKTFELEIAERDPQSRDMYTRSFKREFVVSTNTSMTEINKTKR